MARDLTDRHTRRLHALHRLKQLQLLLAPLAGGFCLLLHDAGSDADLTAFARLLSARGRPRRYAGRRQAQMRPLDRPRALHRLPQVQQQVKAIRYLQGLGGSATGALGIHPLAIASHHNHFRMLPQPLAERLRGPCRQYVYHLAALQIDQDGAEALPFTPGPVVYAHHANYLW